MNPLPSSTHAAASGNLVLIGFMGTGKSSVGRLIAQRTGRRFVDTDHLVAESAGIPISAIFEREGEAAFRDRESAALRSLGGRGLVVATGGGIVERPCNGAFARELGCVVWLDASEDVLFERISRNRKRPLLQTADPRATLRELLDRRRALYEAAAHAAVDSSGSTHAEVAEAVLACAEQFFLKTGAPREPIA